MKKKQITYSNQLNSITNDWNGRNYIDNSEYFSE